MNKQNLVNFFNGIKNNLTTHSPDYLMGVGIAGMLATTILAVKATPKAIELQERKANEEKISINDLTPVDRVKACWKCYIPAALTCVSSVGCLIGSRSVSARRTAALAAAYNLSDTAYREYREKVMETIGEKKERVVEDKISEGKVKTNPIDNCDVIITEKGDTLFFEPISGRYFKSDIEKIKKAENTINKAILSDPFSCGSSLNDFYREIGIPATSMGENIGWNVATGMIDIYLSAQVVEEGSQYEGKPCLVINYRTPPKYDY